MYSIIHPIYYKKKSYIIKKSYFNCSRNNHVRIQKAKIFKCQTVKQNTKSQTNFQKLTLAFVIWLFWNKYKKPNWCETQNSHFILHKQIFLIVLLLRKLSRRVDHAKICVNLKLKYCKWYLFYLILNVNQTTLKYCR